MKTLRTATEATFRVGPLVNLAATVRSLGCDPIPIFRQSGFYLKEFTDPDHRLPYLRTSRLLARCVKATGCDHLGFLMGQKAVPSHLGIPGFLIRCAPKVDQALRSLIENLDLHDEGGNATLDIGREYSTFGFVLHIPGVSATDQIYDLSAVIMCKIMQTLCGADWVATSVNLPRKEPDELILYRRYFRTVLFFNSTECSVTFTNHCLKQEPQNTDVLLYKYLKHEASQLHALQHHEMLEELPAVLRMGLLSEEFSANQIADVFGIRERTLHRRLQAEGTSFRREIDRVRKSVSQQLLESTSLPVCDIAQSLGYADSSGFIRAFSRWTGAKPTSWRKHNAPRLGKGHAELK